MRITVGGMAASLGLVALQPALAQPQTVITSPPAIERVPEVQVVVAPSAGQRPSWCPSTHFNGAHLICEPPAASAVQGKRAVMSGGALDVTLRLGSELIWKGTMFIGGDNGNATISQNRTDTYPCDPEPPRTRGSQSVNTSFNIRIGIYQSAERLSVGAEITRPFADPGRMSLCATNGSGARSIRFDTQVDLAGGKPVTVNGDAGMTLTIARLSH